MKDNFEIVACEANYLVIFFRKLYNWCLHEMIYIHP